MNQTPWSNQAATIPTAPFQGGDAAQVGLEKQSVLGIIYEDRPFLLASGQPITGEFTFDIQTATGVISVPTIMLALENGNSETRGMCLHFASHKAMITQTASKYEEESQNLIYSTGDAGEFWQVEQPDGTRSMTFRVGEHADSQHDLPIGPTWERWSDPRFVNFNHAVIVRTLREAGYGPGTHYVCICPGARNEEVSVDKGVDPRVQDAFLRGLQPFVLWRNKVERYDIRIVEIMPAIPQTFGSYYAFDTDILGRSLNPNVPNWNWLDIGFYDGHDVTVKRVGRNIRVSGVKVTDGMSKIVRGMGAYLRQPGHFPHMAPPTYAQALEMMRSGEVKIGGMPLEGEEAALGQKLMKAYKDREGGNLIRAMMGNHPVLDSVFAFTGGGTIDLIEQIREQTQHRPKNLTKILHPEVARISNVAGIFWLLNLAKRRRSILRSAY